MPNLPIAWLSADCARPTGFGNFAATTRTFPSIGCDRIAGERGDVIA
jgi:hypothetical protein